MASVAALDSQIFFDPFAAASPKPASGDVFARPGNLPVESVGGPQKPQPDVHDSRAGASQDNAFLISDDDKSDDGEVDEGEVDDSRSDAYFPPIEELLRSARREGAKSNSVADRGRNVAPGASDNGNLEWPSLADDTSPSDEDAQSQQPQTCSLERSPAPASLPAGRPFHETGQAPPPEGPVPRASPPGVEARQTPGPPPSPLRLDEATDREGTPRRDSAGGSDGHGEAEPNPRTATLRPGIRRFRRMPSGGPEDEDEAEAVRKPRHRRRRRHDGEGTRGDDMYHPASDTDLDNESSDAGSPPPKRRKRGSWPTPLASGTGRQIGLDDGASRPRPARTRASDEKATSQANATGSPSSPGSSDDDEGASDVPMADYEEWPVRDAVLKLITVNGVSTIHLQFGLEKSSGGCLEHGRGQSLATRRPSAKRRKARVPFTLDEDNLLIDLKKKQGLSWNEIHAEYKRAFPEHRRSWQTLQARFSTKLNKASE